jgi:signal transduction histidine kinase
LFLLSKILHLLSHLQILTFPLIHILKKNILILFFGIIYYDSIASDTNFLIRNVLVNEEKKTFASHSKLSLKTTETNLTFELNPAINAGESYEYFLENFDKTWQKTPYPFLRYTNLAGGEYTLKVRLRNNSKVLITNTLTIQKELSLTEEWWFIPSLIFYAVLLVSAAVYFALLYNFRQKLKVESIRQRIASDLHDEVGATLSSIAIATKLVEKRLSKTTHDLQPILDQIRLDSEESVQTIRDTVWAINPLNDSIEQLFEKMRAFALHIFTVKDIALQFDNSANTKIGAKISMEQRRNVYMIFKEVINNIAKHSDATKVQVFISQDDKGLKLEISDNGKGFDLEENYEGNGLKNFRKRANESFIDFDLHSALGEGTKVEMLVYEM